MKHADLTNSTHIIFGLGQSGLSCARYFDRIDQDYSLLDTRVTPPGFDQISTLKNCRSFDFGNDFNFENINKNQLTACKQLIVSPGISLKTPLVQYALKNKIDVCGDVELFCRSCQKVIVAISGSNGKSTVTDLTEQLLQSAGINAQKAGNIGLPVLDYLPQNYPDVYVLELSSFQLDTTSSLKAKVAVLLNISEDHMDRYSHFSEYQKSKLSIFNHADIAVYNRDDALTMPLNSAEFEAIKTFSIKEKTGSNASLKKALNCYELIVNGKKIISSDQLKITGKHNLSNVLASLNILDCLNVAFSNEVIDTLKSYKSLNHRFQLVKRTPQLDWINDSKATNVGATVAAINSIDVDENHKLILIAGGDSKNSDLSDLVKPFEEKVSALVLMGKDSKLLSNLTSKISAYFVENMQQAVDKAKELITAKGTILLSPACSSIDMYKNFEERGDDFVNAVGRLT